MKRIETTIKRSNFQNFCRCAGKLGILGFDLAENKHAALVADFAVPDTEVKDALHAVLEDVHPDNIAIFKLDAETSAIRH